MAAPIYYTAEMVRALPDDGNRYEVRPAPAPRGTLELSRLFEPL
jgi:hypothetical protein